MYRITIPLLSAYCLLTSNLLADLILKEDFRELVPHYGICTLDLENNKFLRLEVTGEHDGMYKLSHHAWKNDPHYAWNGFTKGPTSLLFHFQKSLDFSAVSSSLKVRTQHSGKAESFPLIRSNNQWFICRESRTGQKVFEVHDYKFHQFRWSPFEPNLSKKKPTAGINWSKIEGVGFHQSHAGKATIDGVEKSSTRLDWFELHTQKQRVPEGTIAKKKITLESEAPFFENEPPFFHTAFSYNAQKGKKIILPRAVIVRLADGHWSCFNIDTMEMVAVWKSSGSAPVTLDSMASVSYPRKSGKAVKMPTFNGTLLFSGNPQTKVQSKNRSWQGISLQKDTVVLNYTVNGRAVHERHSWNKGFVRDVAVSKGEQLLKISTLSSVKKSGDIQENGSFSASDNSVTKRFRDGVEVAGDQKWDLTFKDACIDPYPQRFFAYSKKQYAEKGLQTKRLSLPVPNSFSRMIRPTDIAFTTLGVGYLTSYDGDVWRIANIDGAEAEWKRFATGFNELTNIEIGDDNEIFVLDRNQITQLVDINDDGCADQYKCFSNAYIQTSHTRDFSMSMVRTKNGGFLIAKGGINTSKTEVGHRGSILRVSANGKDVEIIADGLRMPYVGQSADGQIFASDQQGHYVPSTPIFQIRQGDVYGHIPSQRKLKPSPKPYLWFPYLSNRSGAGFVAVPNDQTWNQGESLCHFSWNGRLFFIPLKTKTKFAWSYLETLGFPCLNGAINPKSKMMYVTGVGTSSYRYTTKSMWGLGEVKPSAEKAQPVFSDLSKKVTQIAFSRKLRGPVKVVSFKAWNIKLTKSYGSPHFLWNGEAGEHRISINKIRTEAGGASLLIDHSPLFSSDVICLRLEVDGELMELYFQGKGLEPMPKAYNFSKDEVVEALKRPNVKRGSAVFKAKGCVACHSLTGIKLTGPSLSGVGTRLNDAALKESILFPNKIITKGFEANMPSFRGVVSEQELSDLIFYLSSLKKK